MTMFRLRFAFAPLCAATLAVGGPLSLVDVPAFALLVQQDTAAAASTNADVETVLENFAKEREALMSAGNVTRDSYGALMDKFRTQVNPATLTLDQTIAVIEANLQWNNPEFGRALADRLATWAGEPTVDGVVASMHHLTLMNTMRGENAPSRDEKSKMVAGLMNNPALGKATMEGHASALFGAISGINDDAIYRENSEAVFGLAKMINDDLPADGAMMFENYFRILGSLVTAAEGEEAKATAEARRQEIRQKMVGFMADALAMPEDAANGIPANRREWLAKSMARLDGAAARGELLDHSAPAIAFNWSSDGRLKSLSDLNDKVVILDFWATWCGPCIATFPNVRKLTEFYEGYPVAVIGVTSLQGRHYGASGVTETKDNPDLEYELMKEFMDEKEMTWTVAFSEADVFNPEYGVRGIPHVAIVDAKGMVRENALHPGGQLMEKAKKINKLLEAAGLPAPSLEGLDLNLDPIGG